MSQDITAFGLVINLVASVTYPVGIAITQFSDDADAATFGAIKIGDTAMGLNGDLQRWSRAVPLPVTINVIPGSIDDVNLQILAEANRVGQGKVGSRDVLTMTVIYPDGSRVTFTGGAITDAEFGKSASSAGRLKTKAYAFMFEQKI